MFIVCSVSWLRLAGSHILEKGNFLGKGVYEFNTSGHILEKAAAFKGRMNTQYKNKIYFPIF